MWTKQVCPNWFSQSEFSNKIELAVRELEERNGKISRFHTATSLYIYVTSLKSNLDFIDNNKKLRSTYNNVAYIN